MLLYIVDRKRKSARPVVIICAVCLLATFVSSALVGNAHENVSYSDDAARYLIAGGMTEKEVQQLKEFLMA